MKIKYVWLPGYLEYSFHSYNYAQSDTFNDVKVPRGILIALETML